MPTNRSRVPSTSKAAPPYAASTWNHASSSLATLPIPARSSTTPAFVEPPDATMMPTSRRAPMASATAGPVSRPLVVGRAPPAASAPSAAGSCRSMRGRCRRRPPRHARRPPICRPPAPTGCRWCLRSGSTRRHRRGSPTRSHIHRSTSFSAATAPAASSDDSALKLEADTTASIHTLAGVGAAGMNARNRSLWRPTFGGTTTCWNNAQAAVRIHAPGGDRGEA